MAKHLRREDVEATVESLDRSEAQVTWDGVFAACQGVIGITSVRQVLAKSIGVMTAFVAAKKRAGEVDQSLVPKTLNGAYIASLG